MTALVRRRQLLHIRIAYECNLLTVRRPRWHVNRTLASIEISYYFRRAAADRHQTQVNVFVKRVIARSDVFGKRDENDPFAIGRDVWEPVVQFIVGDLSLFAAIGLHPPDLHHARAE